MTRYLKLYRLFLFQRFKVLLEYRASFILGAVSTIVWQASSIAAVWVVMQKVPNLNGWNYDEVLLIYGLVTLAKSINHMFADNLWTLGRQYIRTGGFDRFLVRPIDPLFHLLADRFCHDGIGNFLIGAALIGWYSPFSARYPCRPGKPARSAEPRYGATRNAPECGWLGVVPTRTTS